MLQRQCSSKAWNLVSWRPWANKSSIKQRDCTEVDSEMRGRMQQDLRAVSRGRDERNLDTLPGPEQICGMAHRSGKSWEEHSRALFVFCETGAKFLTEKQFFTAGLDVKGEPCDRHREQRADFSEGNGGTEKREQNARVDRMTDGAVGPGSNQFMALFERDHTTPIRAEMPTRPKRHSNAVGCQGNAKRSEEHTSELQSHSELACRLLLEKKKGITMS